MSATRSATRAASKTAPQVRRENPLALFVWQGTDKRGIKMKGEQAAKNANLLRAELRRQGITPTVVKPKAKPLFGASGKRITATDIAIFSRQIATMLKSGVPIVTSLEIIGEGHKNPRMKTLLNAVRSDLESGLSLYEAMSRHPVQFDELYRNLVKAGESAGVLETVLDTVATYKENIETLKGKIKKALYYPATVIAVAILVSAILLVFVVPQFKATFQSFGADLPAFTLMVIGMSEFMIQWWWAVLLLVVGAGVAFVMAKNRSLAFSHFIDRMMLKLPIVGQILHNAAIARFARTLAVSFRAGVPLVEALDTVAGATGNVVYEKAVLRIRDDVSVGYQVNMAMKQVNLFPHMVIQMTAIGEEAGALDTMLVKVAEFYEQEVNNAVDALSSLLEPLIMIILGVIVGGMVIAMYLPIFKLAATI
ncbi:MULTISPECIES: type II secretion system F family protein [Lysobacter]|uniref:Type II secretion system F family protein n=1 Tax=Lysobacter yananisis TaxID=1003114 RepID=A0ABY9PEW3_9GAMM|nr:MULTISPECIES: type II secretion system F family protein [Lysobacter]QQQ02453.1 type II secretion system F family protein [Lysobacter enzymogenes]UZW61733.1 type II secretion system F family protein [Lysobacter enzymogenes]WMT05602.1 type II secretion system F family protein [Lysobacter yananisis]